MGIRHLEKKKQNQIIFLIIIPNFFKYLFKSKHLYNKRITLIITLLLLLLFI
jgi:hypothetical protein